MGAAGLGSARQKFNVFGDNGKVALEGKELQ